MAESSGTDKNGVERLVKVYLEENLPRLVNEALDERIRLENEKILRRYMNSNRKLFED